ncbi:hypothetical protein T01_13945, partial [Trichinella spiralis]
MTKTRFPTPSSVRILQEQAGIEEIYSFSTGASIKLNSASSERAYRLMSVQKFTFSFDSQNKFEKCALCHEAPLVAALKRFGVVSWRWLLFLLDQFMKIVVVAEFPARRSVSASTLPLIKTSGQSSTAMISSRMAASEKNSASSPTMANSNIIDFQLLHSKSKHFDNDAITHFSHFEKNVDNVTTLEMDIREKEKFLTLSCLFNLISRSLLIDFFQYLFNAFEKRIYSNVLLNSDAESDKLSPFFLKKIFIQQTKRSSSEKIAHLPFSHKGFPPPPPLPPLIMALQVRFVEGSQVEVPFQSNDSGTIDHGDDVDDDYDHEYNNHRESFSLYEEDGSTSAMKMSHFIRRISLYNPIVSGGDDVDPNKQ